MISILPCTSNRCHSLAYLQQREAADPQADLTGKARQDRAEASRTGPEPLAPPQSFRPIRASERLSEALLHSNASDARPEPSSNANPPLSEAEQAQVEALAARDREVRLHEQAHATVGGAYAGSPSYTYQQGPDGKAYAIGGEVSIDVAPIAGDPAATIAKMRIVRAAALAPAEPSSADRSIAQLADAQAAEATAQLQAQRQAALAIANATAAPQAPGQELDVAA